MRRLLAVPLVAFALLVWSGVATADHEETIKPGCANIADSDTFYATSGIVTSEIIISSADGPSCKSVTYTVVVEVDPGEFVTASAKGNGTNSVLVSTSAITTNDDNLICVHVTSSRGGSDGMNRAFDRYPNGTTCTTIALGGSGGSSGHA
jgi:hypothetical protein